MRWHAGLPRLAWRTSRRTVPVGVGLTLVFSNAVSLHIDATINPGAGFNGSWSDSVGRSGTLAFGPGTGGPLRPVVAPVITYRGRSCPATRRWRSRPLRGRDDGHRPCGRRRGSVWAVRRGYWIHRARFSRRPRG